MAGGGSTKGLDQIWGCEVRRDALSFIPLITRQNEVPCVLGLHNMRGECVALTPIQYGAHHRVQCHVKIWLLCSVGKHRAGARRSYHLPAGEALCGARQVCNNCLTLDASGRSTVGVP